MAITNVNRYYDANIDMYFDSYEHYVRHMDQMRYEQQRMMNAQQAYMRDPRTVYGSQLQGAIQPARSLLPTEDPKDPLTFLKKADNKLLLTGELK